MIGSLSVNPHGASYSLNEDLASAGNVSSKNSKRKRRGRKSRGGRQGRKPEETKSVNENASNKGGRTIPKETLKIGNIGETDNGTPLMLAAASGNIKILDSLLKAGAEVNAVGKDGSSALKLAIKNGNSKCVDLLIRAGADVNADT